MQQKPAYTFTLGSVDDPAVMPVKPTVMPVKPTDRGESQSKAYWAMYDAWLLEVQRGSAPSDEWPLELNDRESAKTLAEAIKAVVK